ncbi:P-loop containing nucleoside triphosphate hydrolase protein [Coprinopsis sp. MPI-PUGE-AT-0042]|nr:P-loop containing nucleoside triphosphate hydrolase protein [Coprinopsis sp. MPI-PUGE-AT-0042]
MGRSNHRKQSDVPVKHKLKKDPGVPKLPDLKVRVRQHTKRPDVPLERRFDNDTQMASEPTLSTLAALAAESSSEVPEDPSSSTPSRQKTREQLRRYYLKSLHKVIDESDIILLVMDARDPEGCRSRLVEEERLVFVLNKIDLVPKANAQAWLKYLRHSTPTLPFLSGSQNSRSNITSSTAPALMKLLKAYKPKTKSVTVGVVGYPNVGKSSLINCLKRSKVCSVAAQPGHTKDLQSIQIERGLKVIDSPGVVFDDDDHDDGKGSKKGSILLRNVVKVEDVEDPIAVVEEILLRTPRETLQKIYSLPEFGTTLEFLTMLALSSGHLNSAARQILMDWNQQKIPYCSQPPEIHPSLIPSMVSVLGAAGAAAIAPGAEQVGQAQILDTLSKPFELDGLFNAIDAGAFHGGSQDVQMDADGDGGFIPDEPMDAEDPNQMESDDLKPHIPRKRSRSPSLVSESAVPTSGPTSEDPSYMHRQPKRQRKSKEIPEYNEQPDKHVLGQMGKSNPLNRRH